MGIRRNARRSIAVGLSAIVAVSILGLTEPPEVNAAFPGATGRIVWQRNDAVSGHIWTMRPDGTDKVELAEGYFPAWSPDGSKLVFTSPSGLEIMDADGTNRSLIAADGSWPTWSPDGTRIAFARFDTIDSGWDIYTMNADGTGVVGLTNVIAEEIMPSWSPDGTRIAYQSNLSGTPSVWTMNADGSDATNLTPTGGGAPDWSPDGTKIAFDWGGIDGIWVMNANGSAKVRVESTGSTPAWSPDGSRIVYTDRDTVNDELVSMAADGSDSDPSHQR